MTLATVLFHDQGREGIGGLAGLGDADREHLGRKGRRCVAEFTRIKHSRGQAGHLLQQVGTHLGRMATGAAGQNLDALHTAVDLLIEGQGHQGSLGQVAGHPQRGGLWLLVDLLEHEMAETALVRHVLGATQQAGVALHPLTGGVVQLDAQGGQQRHLAVFHRQDRAGEAGQGGRIAGAEKLSLPQTNQQWGLAPRHH